MSTHLELSDDQAIELLKLLGWYCLAYTDEHDEPPASELMVKELAGDLIGSLPSSRVRANVGESALKVLMPDTFGEEAS